MKRLYYDLETTGLNPAKHGIHQIAGIIEINGATIEKFNIKLQPNPKCTIEQTALDIAGVTREQINNYQPFPAGYTEFVNTISKHVDQYNKKDKFHLVGYNNRGFDDNFLRELFKQNGNEYFGSYFWNDGIDVLVMASYALESRRAELENFQLKTVAKFVGIEVDEKKLHDAFYDIELTKQILDIITKSDKD